MTKGIFLTGPCNSGWLRPRLETACLADPIISVAILDPPEIKSDTIEPAVVCQDAVSSSSSSDESCWSNSAGWDSTNDGSSITIGAWSLIDWWFGLDRIGASAIPSGLFGILLLGLLVLGLLGSCLPILKVLNFGSNPSK